MVKLLWLIGGFLAGGSAALENGFSIRLAKDLRRDGATWVYLSTSCCWTLLGWPMNNVPIATIDWTAIPWYVWTAGLINIIGVFALIWSAQELGMSLSCANVLFSQMLFSLIFDHLGWLGIPQISCTGWRIGGLIVMYMGCSLMMGLSKNSYQKISLKSMSVPIFGGFCIAFAGILNVVAEPYLGLVGSTMNYLLPGTIILSLWLFIRRGRSLFRKLSYQPLYLYSVGFFNVFLVMVQTMAIPYLGVGVFFAIFFMGQMGLSLWIDHYGCWGTSRQPLTRLRMGGVALMILSFPLLYHGI
jgi:transporter family-2 protein